VKRFTFIIDVTALNYAETLLNYNPERKEEIMKKNEEPRIIATIRSNPCLGELFMNSEEKMCSVRNQSIAHEVQEVKKVGEHADTRDAIIWPDGKLSTLHM